MERRLALHVSLGKCHIAAQARCRRVRRLRLFYALSASVDVHACWHLLWQDGTDNMTRANLYSHDLLAQLIEENQAASGRRIHWLTWMPVFVTVFALLALLEWGWRASKAVPLALPPTTAPFEWRR
jgi:hypothetical protein